jgi:RNA recognition motif-containing protein
MSAKLFVGNLAWAVREPELEAHLRGLGLSFRQVEVLLEHPEDGPVRSRGFGFVHFDTDAEAGAARDALVGSVLFGRPMRVDYATTNQMEVRPGGGRDRVGRPRGDGRRPSRRTRRDRCPVDGDDALWSEFFPGDDL